jgi:DNA mismatch repair protein MLH1
VEDLFYNIPNRRRAFRSPSEEYAKILDVITRYAVHREGVAFSIKKHGDTGVGFTVGVASSKADRIKQAYGSSIAKELLKFSTEDTRWGFKASGYATNANYHSKRTVLLLFINHRSVESSAVKKAIEQTYQQFLPKGGHPFVYLDLEIKPNRVDVNVHPTKREVHFLNEDEIIELVCAEIRNSLAQVDTSRNFKTQTLLPGVIPMTPVTSAGAATLASDESVSKKPSTAKKPYENSLIRTDSKLRKITSMLPPSVPMSIARNDSSSSNSIQYTVTDREQVPIRLTSIKNLRAKVRDSMHNGLTEIFASLTYVGVVDSTRRLAAIQSGVRLFLVDYGLTCNEFFYQIGLTDFGNFGHIRLEPAPNLKELLGIAAEYQLEVDPTCAGLDKDVVVEKVYAQLMKSRAMLEEYFSFNISDDGRLQTIPLLMKGYMPCLVKLPTFLLRLGPFVIWTDEEPCFRTFLRELASFYVPESLPAAKSNGAKAPSPDKDEDETMGDVGIMQEKNEAATPGSRSSETAEADDQETETRRKVLERTLEHVLFPAFRSRIVATESMLKGVVEVANLKGLYRVFERC